MAHKAVAKAFPGPPAKTSFVPRNVFLPDRWTGRVDLELVFTQAAPLVVGAGRHDHYVKETPRRLQKVRLGRKLIVREEPGTKEQFLIAEIVRRGKDQVPVLPGSSLKGALRQVYELLTPSCEPGQRGGRSCSARPRDADPEVCPACSLFGAMGVAGRLGVQEAEPSTGPESVKTLIRRVPTAWEAQRPVPGSYRFYDPQRAAGRDREPRPEVEATWAAWGRFRTHLRLVNASPDELGLLFASLGIGQDGAAPSLRVGGKKFHGFGGAQVRVLAARQTHPERRQWTGEEAAAWAVALRDAALDHEPPRREAWEALRGALAAGR